MGDRRELQRGASLPAILFWLVFAAFLGTVVVKLGPIYVANFTVRSVMNEVAASPEALEEGKKSIRDQLRRRLEVNDVDAVSANAFIIEEALGGTYDLSVEYEVRRHLFFNIDAVLTFKREVLVAGR